VTTRSIASESTETVRIAIQAASDPTAETVSIGFSDTDDAPSVWTPGAWAADPEVVRIGVGYTQAWVAEFSIGPAGLVLAEGSHRPWTKVGLSIRRTDDEIVIF
jgi:hypothetical protein